MASCTAADARQAGGVVEEAVVVECDARREEKAREGIERGRRRRIVGGGRFGIGSRGCVARLATRCE